MSPKLSILDDLTTTNYRTMKNPPYILPAIIASLAITGPSSAQADLAEDNAREHKVTATLKVFYEGIEEVSQKNNGDIHYSQKIITKKVSNKEILEGLVEEGVIADIKGWSIILITGDNAQIVGTYITKKNNLPIDITSFFDASSGHQITAYKGKYIDKTESESGTATHKSLASLRMDIDGVELEVQGVLEADTEYFEDESTDEEFVKKAQFTDLSGSFNEGEGLATGSVKVANGKKITINPVE